MRRRLRTLALLVLAGAIPARAVAQGGDVVGTRAQGMGGAFVGVADDASAVYWNPAGLAGGAYFSLVLDGVTARARDEPLAASRTGWLLALSTPALGLSYYRLQEASARPVGGGGLARVESLVTQHAGATLVQSLSDGIAVGTTIKLVRGVAAAGLAETGGRDAADVLDHTDLLGRSGSRVDLDVGVMSTGSFGRLGLTVRNLTEPGFDTAEGEELSLQRQVRAGASILLLQAWKLAADVDFTRRRGSFGDVREVALGSEGQVTRRLAARAGLRFNTAGEDHGPSVSGGASYAVLGAVLLDAQITGGPDKSFRGWGLAGRFVF